LATAGHGFRVAAVCLFSSRRRHTRFSRDWSSDVCSSDLYLALMLEEFTRIDRRTVQVWDEQGPRRVTYSDFAVEDLEALAELSGEAERFAIYRRLGDLCLFLTGMFADYLAARAREASSRGARQRGQRREDIETYEELGRTYYRRAAEAETAADLGFTELLE